MKARRTNHAKIPKRNLNLLGTVVLFFSILGTSAQLLQFNFDGRTLQPTFAAPGLVPGEQYTGMSSYYFTHDGGGDYSLLLQDNGSPFDFEPAMISQSLHTEPGYVMNISGIRFEAHAFSGDYWSLSLDGDRSLITVPLNRNETSYDIPINTPRFQGISSLTTTFFASPTTSFEEPWGTFISWGYGVTFDNVTIFGSVAAVPEPRTSACAALALVCWAVWRSRVRNSS